MAISPVSCFIVTCDVCKEQLANDEGLPHYDSVDEARELVRVWFPEWTLCADGFAICDDGDAEHFDAIEALTLPEFAPVCDEQAEIPFTAGD